MAFSETALARIIYVRWPKANKNFPAQINEEKRKIVEPKKNCYPYRSEKVEVKEEKEKQVFKALAQKAARIKVRRIERLLRVSITQNFPLDCDIVVLVEARLMPYFKGIRNAFVSETVLLIESKSLRLRLGVGNTEI